MIVAIYKISFVGCSRVYIGQSINLKNRLKCHRVDLKKGSHYNSKLQRACNKYGFGSMRVTILESFDDKNIDMPVLNEREIYYVSMYNSFKKGLNCNTGGGGHLRKCSKQIYMYSKNTGCLVGKYIGFCNAARHTNVGESNIRQCCKGLLKTAKGFHFSLELKIPQQVIKDIENEVCSIKFKAEQSIRSSGSNNPMYGKKRPEISGENNPYYKLIKSGYKPKRKIDYNKVIEMYQSGQTQLIISEHFNCTQAQVSTILRNNGISKFKRKLKN